jgi:hypothetical protein
MHLNDRDAAPVSKTAASRRGPGKADVARLGDEGKELVEFLIGLEDIAAQLVHRADRVSARSPADQLLQRHQVFTIWPLRILSTRARRDRLRLQCCIPAGHPADTEEGHTDRLAAEIAVWNASQEAEDTR